MSASIWEGSQVIGATANADNSYVTEEFTATINGDELFNLTTFVYQPGTGSLDIYVAGVHQRLTLDYSETSNSSVTVKGVRVGDAVTIRGLVGATNSQAAQESADQAAASAAAAAASAVSSAASATASQTSATNSANSATASAASALASSNSATASANSAIASANSATASAASAVTAANIANNVNGGSVSMRYLFSTTTADADPGPGFLRLSNATQNLSTVIRTDLLDANGQDLTNLLDSLDDSSSIFSKGTFRLSHRDDVTKWITFTLTLLASPAGYRNYTVTVTASSAANPFANNDPVFLIWSRTGDKGDVGPPSNNIRVPRSANTNITTVDSGKYFVATAGFTQVIDNTAMSVGWWCSYENASAANVTFDPTGSVTIDGAVTGILEPGMIIEILYNGTNFECERKGPPVKKYLSSGTSGTFPLGVRVATSEQCGGGASGGRLNSGTQSYNGGHSGAWAKKQWPAITPNSSYTYAIGAGGIGQSTLDTAGAAGGATTLTVGGVTVTTNGGTTPAASNSLLPARATATGGDINISSGMGRYYTGSYSQGGDTPMGWGEGGINYPNASQEQPPSGAGAGGASGDSNSIGQDGLAGRIEWTY